MKKFELYDAQVISVNDPDSKGKIQVKILPELKDVPNSNLPWAVPFFSHNSSSEFSNDLPIEGSLVRVLVSNKWKRFYYLSNRFFENLFNFNTVTSSLGKASEITGKNYVDLKFRMYKDGGLEFHNTNTGEHGFIHKSGSYNIFDSTGNIITNVSGNQWKLYGEYAGIKVALKTILKDINTILTHLNTSGNLTSPSGTVVVGTAVTDLVTLNNDLTYLNNLMKD